MGLAGPLQAATYYVSPNGSDDNSGLEAASPWRSLDKVDATTFQHGDKILFQRGGEWRGALSASSSGDPGKPIVYADYGSGAKPIFWGSVVLDNTRFTPVSTTVYRYSIKTPVNALLANHVFLFDPKSQPVEAVSDSYAWDGGTLTLNTPKHDPRTDGRLYTACVREDVIASDGRNHLVFRNLVADESAKADGGYGVRIMGSRDVLVDGCEARRAGKHNFGCINSTGAVFRDCYAAWAMPGLGHGGHSAYVSYGDAGGMTQQTSEYDRCVFDHVRDTRDGGNGYYYFVTHGSNIGSVLLRGPVSHGAPCELDNRESGASLRILGGLLEDNRLELYGKDILVDGLRMTGAQATVDMTTSASILQNMTISGTNLGGAWYKTAVLSRGPKNTVRSCRIVMAADAPSDNTCLAVTDNGNDLRLQDNTLKATGPVFKDWRIQKHE